MSRRVSAAPELTRDMTAKVLRDYSCAWCGVVTRVEVLEQVDGDRVCPACADKEHREREAECAREDDCCGGSGCGACCGGPRWV